MSVAGGLFAFVQLDFGYRLGPPDGRYLVREGPDAAPERVLVLRTLGADKRRGRRGRSVTAVEPAPGQIGRVTVVDPQPHADRASADRWLSALRGDADAADAEIEAAVRVVNRALHAHRAARTDPAARDVTAEAALALRLGFGDGTAVADGRYVEAWEPPRDRVRRGRRSMDAPDERFAALIGGREQALVGEELLLRAASDLSAGRLREAALQARVALESFLSEPSDAFPAAHRTGLEDDRAPVTAAADAALRGALQPDAAAVVQGAVGRMQSAVRARRIARAAG